MGFYDGHISAAVLLKEHTGALCDAREIICCSALMHEILVFPGISPMDLLADFSLMRSELIVVCCGM